MSSYQTHNDDFGGEGFDHGPNLSAPFMDVGYLPIKNFSFNLTSTDLDPMLQAHLDFPGSYHCRYCVQAMPHWSNDEEPGMNLDELQLHLNNDHGLPQDFISELVDDHVAQLISSAGHTKQVQDSGTIHRDIDYATGFFMEDPRAAFTITGESRTHKLHATTSTHAEPQYQFDPATSNTDVELQSHSDAIKILEDAVPQYQAGDALSFVVHDTPQSQHQPHSFQPTPASSTTDTFNSVPNSASSTTSCVVATVTLGAKIFVCELCSEAMPDANLPKFSKDKLLDHGRKFHRLQENEFHELLPNGGFTCQMCAEAMPGFKLPKMDREKLEEHAQNFHRLNDTELPQYFQSAVIAVLNETDGGKGDTALANFPAPQLNMASQPFVTSHPNPALQNPTPVHRYTTALPLVDRPSAKTVFGGPRQPRSSASAASIQARSTSMTNNSSTGTSPNVASAESEVVFQAIIPPPSTSIKKKPGRRKVAEVEDKEKAPPAKRKTRTKKTSEITPDTTLATFATTDGYSCFICASHGVQAPPMNMQEIMGHGRSTHQLIGEKLNEYFVSVMQSFFAAKHSSVNTDTLRGILLPLSNGQAVVQNQASMSPALPQGLNTLEYHVSATNQQLGSPSSQPFIPSPPLHQGAMMQTPGLLGLQAQVPQPVKYSPPSQQLQQGSSAINSQEPTTYESLTSKSQAHTSVFGNSPTPPRKSRHLQREVRTASMGSLTLPTISTPPQSADDATSVNPALLLCQTSYDTYHPCSASMNDIPASTFSADSSFLQTSTGNDAFGSDMNGAWDSCTNFLNEHGGSSIDSILEEFIDMRGAEAEAFPARLELVKSTPPEQQEIKQQVTPMDVDVLIDTNIDPRASSLVDYVEHSGLGLDKEWLKELFEDDLAQDAGAQPVAATNSFAPDSETASADADQATVSDKATDSTHCAMGLNSTSQKPVATMHDILPQISTINPIIQLSSTEQTSAEEKISKTSTISSVLAAEIQPFESPNLTNSGAFVSAQKPTAALLQKNSAQKASVQKAAIQKSEVAVQKTITQITPPQIRGFSAAGWDDEESARRALTPTYASIGYEIDSFVYEASDANGIPDRSPDHRGYDDISMFPDLSALDADTVDSDNEEAKLVSTIDDKPSAHEESDDGGDPSGDSEADEVEGSDIGVTHATILITRDDNGEILLYEESASGAKSDVDQGKFTTESQTPAYSGGKGKGNIFAGKRLPTIQDTDAEICGARGEENLHPKTPLHDSFRHIYCGKGVKSQREAYSDKSPPGESLKVKNSFAPCSNPEDEVEDEEQEDEEQHENSDANEGNKDSIRDTDDEDSDESVSDFTPEDVDDSDYEDGYYTTCTGRRRASSRSTRQTSLADSELDHDGAQYMKVSGLSSKSAKANKHVCSFTYQSDDDYHLRDDGQRVVLNVEQLKDAIFRGGSSFIFDTEDINFSNNHGEQISLETLGWDVLNSLSEEEIMRIKELHGSQEFGLGAKMTPEQRITTLRTSRTKTRNIDSVTYIDVFEHEPDSAMPSIENNEDL